MKTESQYVLCRCSGAAVHLVQR